MKGDFVQQDDYTFWIFLMVVIVAVMGLILAFTETRQFEDTTLIGHGGKVLKEVTLGSKSILNKKWTAELIPDDFYNGCYVEFATKAQNGGYVGGKEIFIEKSIDNCRSYSLAFQFGKPEDALRLAMLVAPASSDMYLESEVSNRPVDRVYLVKYKDYTQVSPKGGPVDTLFRKTNLDSIHCFTPEYFFGIPLYCFNGVVVPGVGRLKDNHYHVIIQPLLFLKLSGLNGMWNPFTGESIHPFNFIKREGVEFFDGTSVMALNAHMYSARRINDLLAIKGNINLLAIKNVDCLEEGHDGAANFQYRSQDLTIKHPRPEGLSVNDNFRYVTFFCRTDSGFDRRMSYAGILFHEANHKFKGHENAACSGYDDDWDSVGYDDDWDSVYGAHAYYLFEASENRLLTCQERTYLYDTGTSEFEEKLCLESHPFNTPTCMAEGTDGEKVVSKEKGKTILKKRLQPLVIPYD